MILAPMRPIPKILDTAPHKHECRRNILGRILSTFEQSNGPHFILVAEWNAYISKSGRRERFDISRSIDPGGQGGKVKRRRRLEWLEKSIACFADCTLLKREPRDAGQNG